MLFYFNAYIHEVKLPSFSLLRLSCVNQSGLEGYVLTSVLNIGWNQTHDPVIYRLPDIMRNWAASKKIICQTSYNKYTHYEFNVSALILYIPIIWSLSVWCIESREVLPPILYLRWFVCANKWLVIKYSSSSHLGNAHVKVCCSSWMWVCLCIQTLHYIQYIAICICLCCVWMPDQCQHSHYK